MLRQRGVVRWVGSTYVVFLRCPWDAGRHVCVYASFTLSTISPMAFAMEAVGSGLISGSVV